MAKKLKSAIAASKIIYLLAALILASWAIVYFYVLCSSLIPLKAYDYEQELRLKEGALLQLLIQPDPLNRDPDWVCNTYERLSSNEIALGQFSAAEKHLQAALAHIESDHLADAKHIASAFLPIANLYRDLNKFYLAKINYQRSIDYLSQTALKPGFNEQILNTAAIDFNNLGVLYFLMGQKATNLEQREKYYFLARDYFVQAKHLMSVINLDGQVTASRHSCFSKNIDENLNQCLVELQFSRQLP